MRFKIVWTLFQKEFLDTFRDKRTITMMIFLPIVLYPLIGLLVSQAQFVHPSIRHESGYTIAISGGVLPSRLTELIEQKDKIRQIPTPKKWNDVLKDPDIALGLDIQHSSLSCSTFSAPFNLKIFFASTQQASEVVYKRVKKALASYKKEINTHKIYQLGLTPRAFQEFELHAKDVIGSKEKGRFVLSRFFPLMIILMTVMGAFYPAIDLTAGEKERGTLETLLTAPVNSIEIVMSKYLVVTVMAALIGALNFFSLCFTFFHSLRVADRVPHIEIRFSLTYVFGIISLLCLVAALASAIMIVVAATARSFKEGQNYVAPVYLVCILPSMMTIVPGAEPSWLSATLPIVNVSYAIQGFMKGTLRASYLSVTVVTMFIFIGLFLVVAAKIFAYEQVLFRSGEYAWLPSFQRIVRRNRPSIGEALALLSLIFVVMFYLGFELQRSYPAFGLGFTLWGIMLFPSLLFARWKNCQWKTTFFLKSLPLRCLPEIVLITIGVFPLIEGISRFIVVLDPVGWQHFQQEFSRAVHPEHFQVNQVVFFFLIAISPAICEECLFRGFVFSSFRNSMRAWPAIFASAFLFAVFHLSLYRFLSTFLLGIVFGWLCYRTKSILSSIFAHALNNSLVISLVYLSRNSDLADIYSKHSFFLYLFSLFLLGIGVWSLLRKTNPNMESQLCKKAFE